MNIFAHLLFVSYDYLTYMHVQEKTQFQLKQLKKDNTKIEKGETIDKVNKPR